MKKYLVVVDMQKDFVDEALGTKEACAIVPAAVEKIRSFDGTIIATLDTHSDNYLNTAEGKKLPVPHCIKGTDGWELNNDIRAALYEKKNHFTVTEKNTFASVDLPKYIKRTSDGDDISIEIIGLCTDICVVSNALLLKAVFPDAKIAVIEKCCAGVTPEKHNAAIEVMKSCQIDII